MYCSGSGSNPLLTAFGIDCTSSPEVLFSTAGRDTLLCYSSNIGSGGTLASSKCHLLPATGAGVAPGGVSGTFFGVTVTKIEIYGGSLDTFSGSEAMYCSASGFQPYLARYGIDCTSSPEVLFSVDGNTKAICYTSNIGALSTLSSSKCHTLPADGTGVGPGGVAGALRGFVVTSISTS